MNGHRKRARAAAEGNPYHRGRGRPAAAEATESDLAIRRKATDRLAGGAKAMAGAAAPAKQRARAGGTGEGGLRRAAKGGRRTRRFGQREAKGGRCNAEVEAPSAGPNPSERAQWVRNEGAAVGGVRKPKRPEENRVRRPERKRRRLGSAANAGDGVEGALGRRRGVSGGGGAREGKEEEGVGER